MRKLLFCIFMMLPVCIFGQDCEGEADYCANGIDCVCETDCSQDFAGEISEKGPIVNLDAGSGSIGDSDQDLNITFNCASDEMAAIMRFLQYYENEKLAQIDLEIKKLENFVTYSNAEGAGNGENYENGVAAVGADLQEKLQGKLDELKELKNGWLQRFETINLIANGDIDGLKNLDAARFDQDFSIEVDGGKLENNLGGRLASHVISGDNMLSWVLFKSATNKTKEDDEKTLQMLKIILENGIDADSKAERTYWIKSGSKNRWPESLTEKETEIGTEDEFESRGYGTEKEFVTELPLVELAILYSFPRAVEMLLEYGAKFIKKRVDFCIYCRIVSDLTSLCVKKACVSPDQGGISKEQLEQLKVSFVHFIEVLGVINFDISAEDRGGQDLINAFNNMFCKHYAQACESYNELVA